MDVADAEEFRALRREIDLRITLQNVILILLCLLFAGLSVTQLVLPARRFEIALIFAISAGMLSLYWVHSGARTLQIRTYLTEVLEPRMRAERGWEVWHARRGFQGVLGSRWFVSTKGVLVGAQVAILAEAWLLAPAQTAADMWAAGLSVLAMVASAVLLMKPRMAPPA
jgi:hypothetical protein